jgi:hypothetical protein
MRPKFDYFRSEAHLRNVAALDCQACGAPGPSQAAHSNKAIHGKGRSIKASDKFTAALCPVCHRMVDESYSLTQAERDRIWYEAFRKTRIELAKNDLWPAGLTEGD